MDVIDEIMATDVVFREAVSGEIKGPEGFKQLMSMLFTAFPDMHFTTEDQVAEADRVVTRYTAICTHTGDFMGIPPTGIRGQVTGIVIWRLAGGKLVEGWEVVDNLGLMQQFGVMPPTRETYTWGEPSVVTGDPGDPESNKAIFQRSK